MIPLDEDSPRFHTRVFAASCYRAGGLQRVPNAGQRRLSLPMSARHCPFGRWSAAHGSIYTWHLRRAFGPCHIPHGLLLLVELEKGGRSASS